MEKNNKLGLKSTLSPAKKLALPKTDRVAAEAEDQPRVEMPKFEKEVADLEKATAKIHGQTVKRITLDLDPTLYRQLKLMAFDDGVTLKKLCIDLIEAGLRQR
jgi:hypothetical protein